MWEVNQEFQNFPEKIIAWFWYPLSQADIFLQSNVTTKWWRNQFRWIETWRMLGQRNAWVNLSGEKNIVTFQTKKIKFRLNIFFSRIDNWQSGRKFERTVISQLWWFAFVRWSLKLAVKFGFNRYGYNELIAITDKVYIFKVPNGYLTINLHGFN